VKRGKNMFACSETNRLPRAQASLLAWSGGNRFNLNRLAPTGKDACAPGIGGNLSENIDHNEIKENADGRIYIHRFERSNPGSAFT